jgi:hypothetical protein
MCSRLLPRAGWLGVVVQPVHAGLLLRRGPAAPVPCSRGGHNNRTGFEYAAGCVPVSFECWAPTGSDLPIPCPSDSCVSHALHRVCASVTGMRVSHALHRVCASVMPFTGYARQSYPSPGMRVSHALHWVCASVMPFTGYARQSCLSPGMRVSHALHKGMHVSHALHKGMRVNHALHRVCASVMLSAFPSSQSRGHNSPNSRLRRCGVQLAPQEGA